MPPYRSVVGQMRCDRFAPGGFVRAGDPVEIVGNGFTVVDPFAQHRTPVDHIDRQALHKKLNAGFGPESLLLPLFARVAFVRIVIQRCKFASQIPG